MDYWGEFKETAFEGTFIHQRLGSGSGAGMTIAGNRNCQRHAGYWPSSCRGDDQRRIGGAGSHLELRSWQDPSQLGMAVGQRTDGTQINIS